ncbi:MAG: SDR family oxidoreductase [Saprospiraceae bacterium]|jgi:short-subunit dehydrogenase|nr:SDR family oxidoreductase [Saprospiraceae bacterium]MBX7178463.1 SDR family oxidoreductase [Saprospiraceae bacterium]MCB0589995.1 SDR family oxidoreductase [Saprospiraceae bacterium]MCO5282767.1 SDR family oxidoreductase [Saprospiraceae bacterium]MCO6470247.1 SDR family oxidoreductase [Saprospiraceae bacterium]
MVIVVTGSTRGIGKAITERFAADASIIFITARNEKALTEQESRLKSDYPDLVVRKFAADLSKHDNVVAFARFVLDNCTAVDILVNNAGIFTPGNLLNEDEGNFDLVMETNVRSIYTLCRMLVPKMIEARKGHLFNICSVAGLKAYPNGGSYSVSKFALLGLTKNLRFELAPHGVKATAVIPGATWTDSWSNSGLPRSRFMEADDIAAMIYHISRLSPACVVEEIVLRPQLGDI